MLHLYSELMKNSVIPYFRDKIQGSKQTLKEFETKHNSYMKRQEVCHTHDMHLEVDINLSDNIAWHFMLNNKLIR